MQFYVNLFDVKRTQNKNSKYYIYITNVNNKVNTAVSKVSSNNNYERT